jgi:hypothetical protein
MRRITAHTRKKMFIGRMLQENISSEIQRVIRGERAGQRQEEEARLAFHFIQLVHAKIY